MTIASFRDHMRVEVVVLRQVNAPGDADASNDADADEIKVLAL